MSDFPLNQLLDDIASGVKDTLADHPNELAAFAKSQIKGIGEYAASVADGLKNGSYTDSQKVFYLEEVQNQIKAAANVIAGGIMALVEAVWNVIVTTVWNALQAFASTILPLPNFV